jgi:hypothetical protein
MVSCQEILWLSLRSEKGYMKVFEKVSRYWTLDSKLCGPECELVLPPTSLLCCVTSGWDICVIIMTGCGTEFMLSIYSPVGIYCLCYSVSINRAVNHICRRTCILTFIQQKHNTR